MPCALISWPAYLANQNMGQKAQATLCLGSAHLSSGLSSSREQRPHKPFKGLLDNAGGLGCSLLSSLVQDHKLSVTQGV